MALRIKRGTDADRTGYTPESGEPIWTIDTNKLYIGDGATAGGVLVTGSGGGGTTPGIDDTSTGVVLTLTDALSTFANDVELDGTDLVLGGGEINGTGDINILGSITASGTITSNIANIGSVNVTAGISAGATISAPFFVGDHLGSVFADDSTRIIDGISGEITASSIINSGITFENVEDNKIINIKLNSDGDLSGSSADRGQIFFSRNDINGLQYEAVIGGGRAGIYFHVDENAIFPQSTIMLLDGLGRLGLGTYTPSEKLDVQGNAIVSGSLTAGAILLSGSNIDTSDSSAITVTPGVTFNSDVVVENDLIVSNKITVDTLAVTNFETVGAGTPELSSDTELLLTAGTRVEITQSPLKMASFTTTERNLLTPANGDIIYNSTDNKFQGYENGAWVNLV